jgi:hypothetical protein
MTETGRNHFAKRRPFLPGAHQRLQERNVDLVEDLVARPAEIDAE